MELALPTLSYQVIRSSKRRRSMSISLNEQGLVTIKTPYRTPDHVIQQFVNKNTQWIKAQLDKTRQQPKPRRLRFINGEQLYLLGKLYPIKLVPTSRVHPRVEFQDIQFLIHVSQNPTNKVHQTAIQKSVNKWYIQFARTLLTQKVQRVASSIDLMPGDIRLRDSNTRWGSCSSKGNLNFNWRIIMAPENIIEYLIIHEVCHLKHRNHSQNFWSLVSSLDPDHKKHRLWIKENAWRLSF